jgi:hypothetical protein
MIIKHSDFIGIHHSYTGAIITKRIILVGVIIGKHEMKTIPDIVFTQVVMDKGVGDKFEINAVTMSLNMVIFYQYAI